MSYYGLPWYDAGPWGGTFADINEEDHCGRTPIFFAAAMGQFESCRVLIPLGADTIHRGHVYGQTPFSLAAAHGHKDVLERRIDNGCEANDHTSVVTPLWLAARVDHLEIFKLLPQDINCNSTKSKLRLQTWQNKDESETDEGDREENDDVILSKLPRRLHSSGRRLACPFHKRSPTKYSAGACNGKGFGSIYRLKSQLGKVQFLLDKIKGHKPCEEREEPTDYENGFDNFQFDKLGSKQLFAGTKSDGECWCTIFDALFPDWPKTSLFGLLSMITREIPFIPNSTSDQDHQNQAKLADLMRTAVSVRDDLLSSATVDQIMNSQDGRDGGQPILEVLGPAYEPLLERMHILLLMKGRESPDRESAADVIWPTSTAYQPNPSVNVLSSTSSSQQRPAPLNMGENAIQINQAPQRSMRSHQNPPSTRIFRCYPPSTSTAPDTATSTRIMPITLPLQRLVQDTAS
ncbi:hypothetical protein S40285_08986 [Stachybotrys chlorohalonatus IBT 40285]|uniref:Uncharacterized protein n=1 Tax=Stachybotrys chlorohalonatus (strain IBT 40285) TaxID=1283841 RepID=A0A084R0Y3_STAC4|nr:hypothetical protein S40285_08986 [Stachybotrys chlorohalonata IBT 40285]